MVAAVYFADLMRRIDSWGREVLIGGYLGEERARGKPSLLGIRIRSSLVAHDGANRRYAQAPTPSVPVSALGSSSANLISHGEDASRLNRSSS